MVVEHAPREPQTSVSSIADPELELAALLRRDPRRAAALLYVRFGKEVRRLVGRWFAEDPDHGDVVQQIFLQILAHGSSLRDPTSLKPWIQTISINTVYAELRSRRVRRQLRRESTQEEPSRDLTLEVEARDLVSKARVLAARLPAKERDVFTRHYFEQRSLEEIASRSKVSLATVKRRLQAANRRFYAFAARAPELRELGPRRSRRP